MTSVTPSANELDKTREIVLGELGGRGEGVSESERNDPYSTPNALVK